MRITWAKQGLPGVCGYVWVNKLTLAPFIGWKSGERKRGREGEERTEGRREKEGEGEREGEREREREREAPSLA